MRTGMFVIDKTGKHIIIIKRLKENRKYNVVPGGRVEIGEKVLDGAIREIREELDLNICKEDIFDSIKNGTDYFFFAKTNFEVSRLSIHGEELERSNANDVYNPMWVRIEEINNMCIFPEFNKSVFFEKIDMWRENG